jgi:hypothetical protein
MRSVAIMERRGRGESTVNTCRICHIPIDASRQSKIAQSFRGLANICIDCYLSEIANFVNAAVAEMKEQEIVK